MKQEKWFDRSFNFENSQNIFPSILERLLGIPIRLEEKVIGVSENILTFSLDNTWTIKENIGHLIDLETLWQGRLDDIINGQIELRLTDLHNRKTDLANHNGTSLQELLSEFRNVREQTILALQSINEETVLKSALHPRLKTPMRTMDLFLFVAEHDDHHLARITELIKNIKMTETKKTRIAIAGIGGIGGYIGGKLAHYYSNIENIEIVFIARGEMAEAINKSGLWLDSNDISYKCVPTLTSDNPLEIGKIDVLIVCTKNFSVEEIFKKYSNCLTSNSTIITTQNTVNGKEIITPYLPYRATLMEGSIYISSKITNPGKIQHVSGPSKFIFGTDGET